MFELIWYLGTLSLHQFLFLVFLVILFASLLKDVLKDNEPHVGASTPE